MSDPRSALSARLDATSSPVREMLSKLGATLAFPRGIAAQSAEAAELATCIDATAGEVWRDHVPVGLPAVIGPLRLSAAETVAYAPTPGVPALRDAWRAKILTEHPRLADGPVSRPLVTQALTHALAVVAELFVDPGDPVVLPVRYWGNYDLIFGTRRGAELLRSPLTRDDALDVDGLEVTLERGFAQRDKVVLLLNFPHNPTGFVPTLDEADALVAMLARVAAPRERRLVVVCDDAYAGLVYAPDALRRSIFERADDLGPNALTIKIDAVTKELNAWGLRVGFLTYARPRAEAHAAEVLDVLENKTATAIRGTVSSVSRLSQTLVLRALESGRLEAEREEIRALMAARHAAVLRTAADPRFASSFDLHPCRGGYFVCLRLPPDVPADAVRRRLLEAHGVGVIAPTDGDLRVSFCGLEDHQIGPLFEAVDSAVRHVMAR